MKDDGWDAVTLFSGGRWYAVTLSMKFARMLYPFQPKMLPGTLYPFSAEDAGMLYLFNEGRWPGCCIVFSGVCWWDTVTIAVEVAAMLLRFQWRLLGCSTLFSGGCWLGCCNRFSGSRWDAAALRTDTRHLSRCKNQHDWYNYTSAEIAEAEAEVKGLGTSRLMEAQGVQDMEYGDLAELEALRLEVAAYKEAARLQQQQPTSGLLCPNSKPRTQSGHPYADTPLPRPLSH